MFKGIAGWIVRHRFAAAILVASLILVVAGLGWAYFSLRGISQPLIIHFTEKTGITEVENLNFVLWSGVFWVFLMLVNIAVAVPLLDRHRFLGMFLVGGTLCIAILIFIWFAAIIHVN